MSRSHEAIRKMLAATEAQDVFRHGPLRAAVEALLTDRDELTVDLARADADDRNIYRRTEREVFVRLLLECDKVLSTLEGEDDTEAEMLEKLRANILRATAPHRQEEADLLSVRADLTDPVTRRLAAGIADRWRDECLRLRAALLDAAHRVESLKRPCGMDPESPQALRNGEYMSIALNARRALGPNVGIEPPRSGRLE